jgi:uncharacterized protein
MNESKLLNFVKKYYVKKDIMHNESHIERILKMVGRIKKFINEEYDNDVVTYGAFFHGCIKNNEEEIREWLKIQNEKEEYIDKIINVSKESLKENEAQYIEGKLLHDAHMLEGGKYFLLIKSLITGSVRGQTFEETIKYFEENVLNYGECYIQETEKLLNEYREEALKILDDIRKNI